MEKSNQNDVYALLPGDIVSIATRQHPMTLPGISVPYYTSMSAATHEVMRQGLQQGFADMRVICQLQAPKQLEPVDKNAAYAGNAVLPRGAVQAEYTVIRNADSATYYTLDTTGLNAQQYGTLARLASMGLDSAVMQQCVDTFKGQVAPQVYRHVFHLFQKAEQEFIFAATHPHKILTADTPNPHTTELQQLVNAINKTDYGTTSVALRAADALWNEFYNSGTFKISKDLYVPFHETVKKASEKGNATDALVAGCKILTNNVPYVVRAAVEKAFNSPVVQRVLSEGHNYDAVATGEEHNDAGDDDIGDTLGD